MKIALKLLAVAALATSLSGCIIYAEGDSKITHTEKHSSEKQGADKSAASE